MDKKLYEAIRKQISDVHVVDAHGHIFPEAFFKDFPEDFTMLLNSVAYDLINAGVCKDDWVFFMAADDRMRFDYGYDYQPDSRSPEQKWEIIKPYWPYVKNIGSGASARKALKLFFDCDDLTDETVPIINKKIAEHKSKYSYNDILRDGFKVDKVCSSTMNLKEAPPTDLISQHVYTDIFSAIQKRRDVYRLEQYANQDIYSLETYVKALDEYLEEQVEAGAIGIKWQFHSYMRDLKFELADPYEAAKCLDRILLLPVRGACGSAVNVGFDEMRPFHNYIQNHLVQRAIEMDLSVQIHTGTFGGTLGNQIENSKPTWLIDMFLRYPQARFDVLHAGFPYMREIGEIAHMFGNVYINTAWVDTLSPLAYKSFVKEWLTYIPTNKLFLFGSDQFNVFNICAGAEVTKDLLSEALAELIDEGRMTENDALFAADCVLRKNAWEFNKFGNKR